ncbi:MAG: hypothetical protein QM538_03035 [Methylacidiphilales bacterium]|nr:hypothetical protein [Candidatus Methylacidiphilales bacterium]
MDQGKINSILNSFRDGFNSEESGVPYDPNLTKSLQSDHELLSASLKDIEKAIESLNFQKIEYVIKNQFKPVLVKHLITESVKLYTYLSLHIKPSSEEYPYITKVRKKMYDIGHLTFRFTTRFSDSKLIEQEWDEFLKQFEEVSSILSIRIDEEEHTLYSLYEKYKN